MLKAEELLPNLTYLPIECVVDIIRSNKRPNGSKYWTLENEVKPVDLYCYFFSRFGSPNGMQNIFRGDHSENMVHWNWTFKYGTGLVDFNFTNFRTYVWFLGDFEIDDLEKTSFIDLIKADFKSYGKEISQCRNGLEQWTEFVNPYQRLEKSIDTLISELEALKISEIEQPIEFFAVEGQQSQQELTAIWNDCSVRMSKAFGICFGIRSMLPVLAEAFINLILCVYMRPEIKADARLRDSCFKKHIDIRIRGLHIDCYGFKQPIDYANPICGKFHSLINERNDLLHGNIAINKLKFNELYFSGTTPIFKEYRSMWHRAFNVQREAVGLDAVLEERETVNNFIEYVLSCLDDNIRSNAEHMMLSMELGYLQKEDRVGILFNGYLNDFRPGPPSETA